MERGLNFALTPKAIPVMEIATRLEECSSRVPAEEREVFRVQCRDIIMKASAPKHNVSKEENEALKRLKMSKNIMILPADKGNSTVVMNKEDYDKKIMGILDEGGYVKLRGDQTTKIEKYVKQHLKKIKHILP